MGESLVRSMTTANSRLASPGAAMDDSLPNGRVADCGHRPMAASEGAMMRRVATVMALASIAAVGLFAGAAQAHQGICTETTNPHGQNVPPAGSTTLPGPNGGQNEDGFYLISSNTGVNVFVVDQGTGTTFGPYPSGTVVKYTEANGATPSVKSIGSTEGQAGAVLVHIQGQGDMGVRTSDSGVLSCLVPPPPK